VATFSGLRYLLGVYVLLHDLVRAAICLSHSALFIALILSGRPARNLVWTGSPRSVRTALWACISAISKNGMSNSTCAHCHDPSQSAALRVKPSRHASRRIFTTVLAELHHFSYCRLEVHPQLMHAI